MGEHKFKKSQPSSYKSKRSRSVATTVIVLAAIVIIIVMDVMQRKDSSPLIQFAPERTKGAEGSPLKIVEFFDFQCPMCKKGSDMLKEYMAQYPQGIQLTAKYYPLGELNSFMSAYYAECAARQGKFWDMHDQLFATQDEWRTLLRILPYFDKLSQSIGLNVDEMNQCIERKDVKKLVAQEKAMGESRFVKSTPTYFINGEMVVGIRALEDYLKEYFEKETSNGM
ncbi:MAG TPA: thioredoxin domain-containing protein [Candidatus Omnitrophota bacterium]|nr:thioredoxin domain-containing protein [Candidatus Omnitrophota bacterium]